jgi:hypothetical protein
MIRRDFFKTALAFSAACSPLQSFGRVESASPDTVSISPGFGPAPIIKSFTARDHRQRLSNIAACEQSIHACLKKHLVTGYIPGQASYNLGEYPSRKPYDPDEYDEQELDRLRDNGIRLIQIMEDWNDMLRLFGGTKFTAVNPAGLRRFIDMAHRRGIKVLLYASTGYMQRGDPDLRSEWVRDPGTVQAAHWRLVRCSPASPGWRAYVLPRTLQILDDYGPDGLFNDWGYRNLAGETSPPTKDEVLAFKEARDHDAALEDMVAIIHSEVKRRGGIYKMHADNNNRPQFKHQLYDYLWVGEGVGNLDKTRMDTKDYPPYVVPCFDFRNGAVSEEEMYVQTIPYLQFPLLLAGRPFTGERAMIPGVAYRPEAEDSLLHQWRKIWKYYQEHPNGPYVYGPWDAFPPRPNLKETHARWLKQYLPLVQEGTWAYIEISDSDLFAGALPANTVASVFTNLETYLVIANYDTQDVTVHTAQPYVVAGDRSGEQKKDWTIQARSLRILRLNTVEP